jgi:hypothetical protein
MTIENRTFDTHPREIPEDEIIFAEEMRTPLTVRDYDRLVDLIDNPPEPTAALRRAFAKYAKQPGGVIDREHPME